MSKDINIRDCRKAVNQAKYSATAERKARAIKLLKELTEAVSNLKEVKPKAKAKPKAKKKATPKVAKKNLAKLTKAELLAMLSSKVITKTPLGVEVVAV
jgi:hypothetical protein|tara:strand:- start:2636 stop:2932 length:297 start_codon:yes stop_codon:yes gene_type:complete